jgi:hypothetical protein
MNATHKAIEQQIRPAELGRVQLVAWSETSLKVSKGLRGVIVTYLPGLDLYRLQAYKGFTFGPSTESIFADELAGAVKHLLGR